jgi:CIC family chloride channel protein
MVDDQNRLIRICSINDFRGKLFSPDSDDQMSMSQFCTEDLITITPAEDLNSVLMKFTIKNLDSLPVMKDEDPEILIGMLNRRDVIALYNQKVKEMKRRTME